MTVRRSAHGKSDYGIDPEVLHRLAGEIKELAACGAQVAIVIGGGNILRGQGLAANTAWVLK